MGQEVTVRTLYGTTDSFKMEKGVQQGCLLSPYVFNLHVEHIVRNAGLDELQAGIKIGGKNINNLRYVDDTTLMAESEEELNSLLIRVKEESERAGLKLNIKNLRSGPITTWKIEGERAEIMTDFLFWVSKISVDSDCSHKIRRQLFLGQNRNDKPRQCVEKQRHYSVDKGS